MNTSHLETLLAKLDDQSFRVGIIGLGYVGLPLAMAIISSGLKVTGFDINPDHVRLISKGESFIRHIPSDDVAGAVEMGRFEATTDFTRLSEADALLICVPTPITRHRDPDLSYVEKTTRTIAEHLRPGQLIVLESTTYPGTTKDLMRPILEADGLSSGKDFFLAYSPEREDPGNASFSTGTIPKVVGGDGADALALAEALYRRIVVDVVPVSSTEAAEAVKLTENIFRSVNIALVNELKVIYERMGIDIWEVVEAAKSKPFGYMPFYPGPGLGGHCIPIDPYYLTWKAREFDINTRFIELAGEVNTAMPYYVVDRLAEALDRDQGRGLRGANILLLGLAYKKNIDDLRESPSLKILEILADRGAEVTLHDPYISEIPRTRAYAHFAGKRSEPLTAEMIARHDAAFIITDHDEVDYRLLATHAKLVVDTRNVMQTHGLTGSSIVKA